MAASEAVDQVEGMVFEGKFDEACGHMHMICFPLAVSGLSAWHLGCQRSPISLLPTPSFTRQCRVIIWVGFRLLSLSGSHDERKAVMQAASRLAVILGESSIQGQELMAASLRLSTQPFPSDSATGGCRPAETAILSDSLRPRHPRLNPAFEQWPSNSFVQGMLNDVSVEEAPVVKEEPKEVPRAVAMAPPADGRLELLHKVRTGDPTWRSHLHALRDVINVNSQLDSSGNSLLHAAAGNNQHAIVLELLKLGASPHARDMHGFTPADKAVQFSHIQDTKGLVELLGGVSPDAQHARDQQRLASRWRSCQKPEEHVKILEMMKRSLARDTMLFYTLDPCYVTYQSCAT